jgi:hypothetical protein
MLVTLPSGATAPLEVPNLPALLAARGDLMAIAAASFAHEEVEVDELLGSDLYFIAEWALDAFAAGDEGKELAIVCGAWGRSPAQVIGLADLSLAWAFERALFLRMADSAAAPPASDDEDVSA